LKEAQKYFIEYREKNSKELKRGDFTTFNLSKDLQDYENKGYEIQLVKLIKPKAN
jgi:hypothetical protein